MQAKYDLDNIILSDVQEEVLTARFELEHLLVQVGWLLLIDSFGLARLNAF